MLLRLSRKRLSLLAAGALLAVPLVAAATPAAQAAPAGSVSVDPTHIQVLTAARRT